MKISANLNQNQISDFYQRHIPSKGEISQTLFGKLHRFSLSDKTLDDFLWEKCKQFLFKLHIDNNVLQEYVYL